MHHRTICLCCSSVRTVARYRQLSSPIRPLSGGWPKRDYTAQSHPDSQTPSQDATATTSNAGPTGSSLDNLSGALDEELRELLRVKHEEAKDVFLDDLSATLEAHRATNRANIVRKLNQKAKWKSPFKNPLADAVAITLISPILNEEQGAEVTAEPLHASAQIKHLKDGGIGTPSEVAGEFHDKKEKTERQQGKDSNEDVHRDKHWPADSIQNAQYWRQRKGSALHEIQEYKAMYILPRGDYHSERRENNCPWLDGLGTFATARKTIMEVSSSRRLYDEIIAYEKYMKLSPVEDEAARLFTAEVKSIVRKTYPKNPLIPIGSHSTGLADRLSDFDFTLSFPCIQKSPLERGPSSTRPFARKAGRRALLDIYRSLDRSSQFRDIEHINARVPIIKAIHTKTQFRVELQTLSSHEASREYSMYYVAEFPTLRPLYIVIRSALHLRHLNVVHEGGLGSYSILMMIVNALKHASGKYAQNDLVNHFLHVLDFYSNANLYRVGFSPDPPRIFRKTRGKISAEDKIASMQDPVLQGIDTLRKLDPKKPYLLCLQDPANAVNDLGCKAYGIKHIQEFFRVIRKDLTTNMKAWDGNGDFKEPWHARGLLAPLLAADYSKLEEKRDAVEQWVVKKNPTFHNHPCITGRQRYASGFHQGNMQITEPQNRPNPLQHSTHEADDPEYTVLESTTGELRVRSDNVWRAVDGSVGGVHTNRHSVARGHRSHARSHAEPVVHTDLAIDKDQSTKHSESSPPVESSIATQIQGSVLSKDSTAQQGLRSTEQGNTDLAIDQSQSNEQSEPALSFEPPKTTESLSTLQPEDSSTVRGLQSTEHGNGLSSGRKGWSVPAVNKWKKWVPETTPGPDGGQQGPKADTGQTLENSRAAPALSTNPKAEATSRGEMLSQPGRLEHTRSTAVQKRNLSRRFVKNLDAPPPMVIKGLRAVQTEKPGVNNRRGVFTHAPHIISEQSENHNLDFAPSLIETQAAMSQDEYSTGKGSAHEIKAWKTLDDATEGQNQIVKSVEQRNSNHHVADESGGRDDHELAQHRAPGEGSTSLHKRNIKTEHRRAIERFHEALLAITNDPEGQATLLSKVETVDRKLDPDEFLKLEKEDRSKQAEFQPNLYCRFRLVKGKKTEGEPEVVRRVNATTSAHVRSIVQTMGAEDESRRLSAFRRQLNSMASKSGSIEIPSKNLFRVHGTSKGILTPSRLGLRGNDISWNSPNDQAEDVDPEEAGKPHPLHWVRHKIIKAMGKELGWSRYKDDAVTEPSEASTGTATESHNEIGRQIVESPPLDRTKAPIIKASSLENSKKFPFTPAEKKEKKELIVGPKERREAKEQEHKVKIDGKDPKFEGKTVGGQKNWKKQITKKKTKTKWVKEKLKEERAEQRMIKGAKVKMKREIKKERESRRLSGRNSDTAWH